MIDMLMRKKRWDVIVVFSNFNKRAAVKNNQSLIVHADHQ